MVFKNKYEWICHNNCNKYKATGRTTRLADDYIQQLFKNIGKWVLVVDHFPIRKATEGLVDIIANRLISEHNIVIEIDKTTVNGTKIGIKIPDKYNIERKFIDFEGNPISELEYENLKRQLK